MHKRTLVNPIFIDGKKVEELVFDFNKLDGVEIMKIEDELRAEGVNMVNVNSQKTLLMCASKATGILPDDLIRMSGPDFLEATFLTRNFLLGSLPLTEASEKDLEKSTQN